MMLKAGNHALSSSSAPRYAGLRVTILGMARQGLAIARFFIEAGAQVTLSDLRTAEQLVTARVSLERFADAHAPQAAEQPVVRFVLGGHPLSLLAQTDLLCLSGGVSPAIPIVAAAVAAGIPLSNDGQLTLRHCPAPVLGITGSAGKTTTTTLIGLMLEAAGFTVHVGGNIGAPLLDRLAAVRPGDKVVMELSSFQLELFDRSPAIAAITNITPNHLDRHPSMSHYAAAKANILRFQEPGSACVLNADDSYTGPWLRGGRCQIAKGAGQDAVYFPLQGTRLGFSLAGEVEAGAFLAGGARSPGRASLVPDPAGVLVWRRPGLPDVEVCRARDVRLRGRHNLANVLAAICVAGAAGANAAAMAQTATSFGGVEHRLEIVRQRAGVLWVNDSIATAPERTVAALRSFSEPIILLAGGRDKNLPWDECAAVIHERTRAVVLFGEAAGLIADALARYERQAAASRPVAPPQTISCADLPEAVAAAARLARPGEVALLSPGGTSFDAYEDFAARGRHFRALVEALP
jgi:UDP-N-acetylmuramoylalanine--D-glutamate ligase